MRHYVILPVPFQTLAGLLDIIGNNNFGHNFNGCFLSFTRRLCKLQAISMTKSENSSLVFLKISFTIRQRLTPERACSTLTRIRESLRLVSFSLAVSSFLRGFFSVDRVFARSAHSLENRYPYARSFALDTKCFLCLRPSYHAFFPDRSDSGRRYASSWQSQ